MIIFPDRKIVYIHIPRTGGTALKECVVRNDANAIVSYGLNWQHATARMAAELLPGFRTIAVIRNPWNIYRSHYGWVHANAWNGAIKPDWFRGYIQCEAAMTFAENVANAAAYNVLEDGLGFHARYCLGDTTVLRYEDDPWLELARLIEVDLSDLNRVNESPPMAAEWEQDSVELVRSRCARDTLLFGYTQPMGHCEPVGFAIAATK